MRLMSLRVASILASILIVPALLPACAETSEPEIEREGPDGARILGTASGALTAPSRAPADDIVRDFLRTRGAGPEVDGLRVTSRSARGDISHLRMEQAIDGVRVVGAYVKAALSDKGELLHLIERVMPKDGVIPAPAIGERTALQAALDHLGYAVPLPFEVERQGRLARFSKDTTFHRAPTVERVIYNDELGGLQPGFLVETWGERGNQLDHTLVDGHGRVVSVEGRTANESYSVFLVNPDVDGQTVVAGTAWLDPDPPVQQTTIKISGPNVRAYLDTNNDNAADTGGTPVDDGNFLTAHDDTAQPSTPGNQAVAVQNLFFLNNVLHDTLYDVGFTPGNGNFEGNDPVNAEAQDGGGINNANFATPADGSSPRMQMYLWSAADPDGLLTFAGTTYQVWGATFGPGLPAAGVSAQLALFNDKKAPRSDGCQAAVGSFTGKIVIVDRGTCDFTTKVLNAQRAGALGVIVANNVAGDAFAMGGTSSTITIPSIMVTYDLGLSLKAAIGDTVIIASNPVESPMLDASLDFDIVAHEYGHGLTWRMIGSMSGPLSGAIGEGASDVLAFLLTENPVIGEYSMGNDLGIRRYAYDTYPLSYGAVTGVSVHDDGEIYAGAMWKVYQNYVGLGLTADHVLADFVEGMDYTPAGPYFEHMRDGMLQAVAGNTARECAIWRGFAASGIGQGASARVRGSRVTINESFTVPAGVCP